MSSVSFTLKREGPVRGTHAGAAFKPQTWLFPVYDRYANSLMLSCEKGKQLYMGRLDLTAELAVTSANYKFISVDWEQVATTSAKLSDHWHIFAHGVHYISYNDVQSPGTELYALRIRPDLANVSSPTELCVISKLVQSSTPGVCVYGTWNVPSAAVLLDECIVSLNDHFIVVASSGVFVVVANQRTNMLLVVQTDTWLSTATLVGDYEFTATRSDGSPYPMQAGGSAWRGGKKSYHVVTQTSFSTSDVDSDIYYGETDDVWTTPTSPTWEISEVNASGDEMFLMFPTRQKFKNGWSVVTYIRQDTSLGYSVGGGDVVRQLFDSSDAPSGGVEVLRSATSALGPSRPHVTLVGNYLITGWDENRGSKGFRCYMRIDEVTLT